MLKPLAIALACLLPIAASADPFYVRVSGVAADDTLNIRAEPNGSSADIGDLAHDARGVEITALDDTGKWGRIIWFEGDGWISMRYTAPDEIAYVPETEVPLGLRCGGTEPFWDLEIGAASAKYNAMTGEMRDLSLYSAQSAAARRGFPYLLVLTEGDHSAQALIRPQHCSDGMSDRTYPYSIDLLLDGGMSGYIEGCCNLPLR